MNEESKKGNISSQLVVPVLLALAIGGSSPWWIKYFEEEEYLSPLEETIVSIPGQQRFLNGQLWLNLRNMEVNSERTCKGLAAGNVHRFAAIIQGVGYRHDYPCLMQGQDAKPHFEYKGDIYMLRVGKLDTSARTVTISNAKHINISLGG